MKDHGIRGAILDRVGTITAHTILDKEDASRNRIVEIMSEALNLESADYDTEEAWERRVHRDLDAIAEGTYQQPARPLRPIHPKLTKLRREFTTQGPDPTAIVEWTIVDQADGREVFVNEFQQVYRGYTTGADRRIRVELDELAARLIHEGLELEHATKEEARRYRESQEDTHE